MIERRRKVEAPSLNKHQLRTEATRRALLKSARRIFAHDGFEACRLEDITAAIGHTRGAFYAHFRTKEDLFFALLEQEAEKRLKQINAALSEPSIKSKIDELGAIPIHADATQFAAMFTSETELWRKVVELSGQKKE